MMLYYLPKLGSLEVTPVYVDNEIFCREIRFSVPASEWCEFEKSQLYLDLKDFVETGHQQTPDMRTDNHVQECIKGNVVLSGSSTPQRHLEWLWEQVRKRFCQR